MNAKQRRKNRQTASGLKFLVRSIRNSTHVCENCGGFGGHWVQTRGTSLQGLLDMIDDQEGFWTCQAKPTSESENVKSDGNTAERKDSL